MVIQGNASSYTQVTTNVQGSGSVNTHIQSSVNGVTKTLDSNKPGTYTLDNKGTDTTSPTASPSVTPTPSPSPSPSPMITKIQDHSASFLSVFTNMRQTFHDFIQKLLATFHL